MAYRQLCAVTFALLGCVVACGGNTAGGSTQATTTDPQPPSNGDRAPNNASDQAPKSSGDPAPTNPDAPPGSSDTPAGSGAGGRIGQLCQQLCDRVAMSADDCTGNMNIFGMEGLCKDAGDCQVPADLPCQNEIAGLFDCLLGLASFCDGQQTNDEAKQCAAVLKPFTDCEKANTPTPTPIDDNPKGCYTAGGCDCANDCLKCSCKAGTDTMKQLACAQTDACMNP